MFEHAFMTRPPGDGSYVSKDSIYMLSSISSNQTFEQESSIRRPAEWNFIESLDSDLPIAHSHILELQEICPSDPNHHCSCDKSTNLLRPNVRFLSKIGRSLLEEHYRRLMPTPLKLNGVSPLELSPMERQERHQYFKRILPPTGVAIGSLRYTRKNLGGIYSTTCEKEGCCYQPDSFLSLSKHLKKGHYRMERLVPQGEGQLGCLDLPNLYYPINPARMKDPLNSPKPIHVCRLCDIYFSPIGDIQKHFALIHPEKYFNPRVTGLLKHCSHCQELIQRDSSRMLVCKIPLSSCPPDVVWKLINHYLKFDAARSISAHPLASLLLFPNPRSPLSLPEPLAKIVSKRCASEPNGGRTRLLSAISAIRGCLHPIYKIQCGKGVENSLNLDELACTDELLTQDEDMQNPMQPHPERPVWLSDQQANESSGANEDTPEANECSSSLNSPSSFPELRRTISGPSRLAPGSPQGTLPVLVWNRLATAETNGPTVGSCNPRVLPSPSYRRSINIFSPRGSLPKIAPKLNSVDEVVWQHNKFAPPKPSRQPLAHKLQDLRCRRYTSKSIVDGNRYFGHGKDNSLQIKAVRSRETCKRASMSLLVSHKPTDSGATYTLWKVKKTTADRKEFTSGDSTVNYLSTSNFSERSKEKTNTKEDSTTFKGRSTLSPKHSPKLIRNGSLSLIINSRKILIPTPKGARLTNVPLKTNYPLPGTRVFSKLLKRAGDVLEQNALSAVEEPPYCNISMRVSNVLESAAKILARAKLPPVFNLPSDLQRDSPTEPAHPHWEEIQMESREPSATETEESECCLDRPPKEIEMEKMMCPVCSFLSSYKQEIISHILANH